MFTIKCGILDEFNKIGNYDGMCKYFLVDCPEKTRSLRCSEETYNKINNSYLENGYVPFILINGTDELFGIINTDKSITPIIANNYNILMQNESIRNSMLTKLGIFNRTIGKEYYDKDECRATL